MDFEQIRKYIPAITCFAGIAIGWYFHPDSTERTLYIPKYIKTVEKSETKKQNVAVSNEIKTETRFIDRVITRTIEKPAEKITEVVKESEGQRQDSILESLSISKESVKTERKTETEFQPVRNAYSLGVQATWSDIGLKPTGVVLDLSKRFWNSDLHATGSIGVTLQGRIKSVGIGLRLEF